MTTPKLMLTIVAGGVLLGTIGGKLANPVMKFAEHEDRRASAASQFSSSPGQFVDMGPEDLSPLGWFGPGYSQPAEYVQPATYMPPAADQDYGAADFAPADEIAPYQPAEVDQASTDAADTAAALTEEQGAVSQPADAPEAPAPAPQAHQIAAADKAW